VNVKYHRIGRNLKRALGSGFLLCRFLLQRRNALSSTVPDYRLCGAPHLVFTYFFRASGRRKIESMICCSSAGWKIMT
jgi:hypothetical protein